MTTPLIRILCTAGVGVVLLGAPAEAQTEDGVRGSVEASLGLESLGGNTLGTVGGRLWLHLDDTWRVGFGGTRGLNRPDDGALAASGLEATLHAWGVTLSRRLPRVRLAEASLSLGSAAVSLENAIVGTTLDSEAVWTVEPAIRWLGRGVGPVQIGAEAGYRWVFGADGLSRLDASDLRTFTVRVLIGLPPL